MVLGEQAPRGAATAREAGVFEIGKAQLLEMRLCSFSDAHDQERAPPPFLSTLFFVHFFPRLLLVFHAPSQSAASKMKIFPIFWDKLFLIIGASRNRIF